MKIYMSGSMYGGTQKIETYKILIKELKKYGEILNNNIADEEAIAKEEFQSDEEIYNELQGKLKIADLVFAEVTIPSLGVGYELGLANQFKKKMIAIYDQTITKKVSTMIRGNKKINLIPYSDISEIINNLDKILNAETKSVRKKNK